MAEKNRNRSSQSNQYNEDWEQNKMRQSGQGYNQNRENEGNYGNANYGESYNTGSLHNRNENMSGNYGGRYGRSSYMPQHDENRHNWGNQQDSGYGSSYGAGNTGHNYEDQNENDWNRRRSNWMNTNNEGNNWGNSGQARMDREDWGRGRANTGMHGNASDRNYGQSYKSGSMYQDSNYGNIHRQRDDRDWWDKTRDEVSSWFGDDDAERRRRNEDQHVGIHRGKGPRDYNRSEERIKEDVCDRLADDPFVDASDIEVKVEGTEVILSGTVDSRNAKRRAEDLVESISGVRNVENRIKVTHDRNASSGDTNERGGGRF